MNKKRPAFRRYIGIDYSGAEIPTKGLKGLRIYEADQLTGPREVAPPPCPRKYWTRRGIAEWLVVELSQGARALVGIDHGFSFPLQYFKQYGLPLNWPLFLDDFQQHWPTDEENTCVDFVRDGICGSFVARHGDPHWRRVTEVHARAKSVFQFNVPGSVAHSTHAGLPWLRRLRDEAAGRVHFWPFDGWEVPAEKSVVAEVYPALWSHTFSRNGRTPDQHDAYSVAEWLRRRDLDGSIERYFRPELDAGEREAAEIEGWILGLE